VFEIEDFEKEHSSCYSKEGLAWLHFRTSGSMLGIKRIWTSGRVWDPIPVPDKLESRIGDPGLGTYDLGSIRSGQDTCIVLGEHLATYWTRRMNIRHLHVARGARRGV
jgi:hypothetical protein